MTQNMTVRADHSTARMMWRPRSAASSACASSVRAPGVEIALGACGEKIPGSIRRQRPAYIARGSLTQRRLSRLVIIVPSEHKLGWSDALPGPYPLVLADPALGYTPMKLESSKALGPLDQPDRCDLGDAGDRSVAVTCGDRLGMKTEGAHQSDSEDLATPARGKALRRCPSKNRRMAQRGAFWVSRG